MCDGEQRDAGVLDCLVHATLHVDAHRARALVQQGVLRPGVTTTRGEGFRLGSSVTTTRGEGFRLGSSETTTRGGSLDSGLV